MVLETEISYKPALKLYDPVSKSIETEDVNPMTGLTADTPANPDDESNRIGSHTRELKYATKKTNIFGTKDIRRNILPRGDPSITPDPRTVQGFTPSTSKGPKRCEDMTADIEENK